MKERTFKITELLALVVFTLFALCLLLVLLTGARDYRNLVARGGESYAARTAAMYVTTRVRQAQSICVEDFGGCESLTTREEQDGEIYLTRIYCYGGWLWELYSSEDAALSPGDGEQVLEAEAMALSLENDLLTVDMDGTRLVFWLGQGKEAKP